MISNRRGQMKLANEIAARRGNLSDTDHAVHAAFLLGAVTKTRRERRGVTTEVWLMGDRDVTESMNRLVRACMLYISARRGWLSSTKKWQLPFTSELQKERSSHEPST